MLPIKLKGEKGMLMVAIRSILVVLVTACAACGEVATVSDRVSAVAESGDEVVGDVYENFLLLRRDGTIVLACVGEDGFGPADVWTNKSLEFGWKPLVAARGKLYGIRWAGNQLLEIDLASGQCGIVTNSFAPYYYHRQSGRFYCTKKLANGYRLVVYDLVKGIWRDIMESPFREEAACFTHIAVSLDERFVAFPEPIAEEVEGFSKAKDMVLADSNGTSSGLRGFSFLPFSRLVFAELDSGRVTRLPWEFVYAPSGGYSGTGAFPIGRGISIRRYPNQITWYDSKTVLVVRMDYPVSRRPRVGLAAFDIETGQIENVAALPMISLLTLSGSITQQGDENVRLVGDGDVSAWPSTYRVDLKAGPLIEDNSTVSIGGAFRCEGGNVLWKGKTIEGSEGASSVAVSPDGRRILWRRSPSRKGKDRYDVLCWDSVKGGEPVVAAEDTRHTVGLMWVGKSGLVEAEIPEPPMPWKRITASSWPKPQPRAKGAQSKPNVTDLLSMELKTDKSIYKQHEQVMLTVILTNITDDDLTVNEHGPAFNIWLKTSRSRRLLSQFDHRLFDKNPAVIKAGESIEGTGAIEIYHLGSRWFSGRFCAGGYKWKGQLSAKSQSFEVRQSADAEELLKAKFYRLIAPCKDPNTKHTHQCRDVVRLGPAAAKYLIAELEATDDPDFHRKMAWPLIAWSDPNNLPYVGDRLREDLHKKMTEGIVKLVGLKSLPRLKKWLEGNMGPDQRMVFGTLARLCRDPATKEQAIVMLLGALDHREAGIRHDAAAVLRDVNYPRVVPALKAMVGDKDAKVAALVSRHFAAREGLNLAEWFALTAKEPTHARYVAAKSIIAELEEKWQISEGKLPALSWKKCVKNADALEQFRQTVLNWEKWARKNPNFSSRYFRSSRNN